MRILLDEGVPEALSRLLPGHQIDTVQKRAWDTVKNGTLLKLAEEEG